MTLRLGRPQSVPYEDMEQQVLLVVRDAVFGPLMKELSETMRALTGKGLSFDNSKQDDRDQLVLAIRLGRIGYSEGAFFGSFSAATSRALEDAGATWRKRGAAYGLEEGKVPSDLMAAIVTHRAQHAALTKKAYSVLDETIMSLDQRVSQFKISADRTVHRVYDDYLNSGITVSPLTEESKQSLMRAYVEAIDRPIKDLCRSETERLRKDISSSLKRGARAESLVQRIQELLKGSREHARFVARQETSEFVASFRKERFSQVGVTQYVWKGAKDERERPDHRALEGQIFFYSQPPITNRSTGDRNNPGEDWGCRCEDMPVIPQGVPA